MFQPQQYELLDFGQGRKLERFGGTVVDRPCQVAEASRAPVAPWHDAVARFPGKGGRWQLARQLPEPWLLQFGQLVFELRPTDFGQVGVFPEQATNWDWLARRLRTRPGSRVLNLFAYTGGSTLAAAAAGASVVHLDAAKNVVSWARRNAEHSQLLGTGIRWIVEDAMRFAKREVNRGNQYDGIILDPPSYGHGPKGEVWKLSKDLLELLHLCRQLLSPSPVLLLLSCHTPGYGPAELNAMLSDVLFGSCSSGVRTRELVLRTVDGRKLPSGSAAYWP